MENPKRLEPADREMLVETELASGILLRGFVDRVDVAPNGMVRVVDYKTGRSPRPRYQDEALFQMRFYALMLWRLHGRVPARSTRSGRSCRTRARTCCACSAVAGQTGANAEQRARPRRAVGIRSELSG